MRIHQRFDSEKEYVEFFNTLIEIKSRDEAWREEDLPKLQPFFEYDGRNQNANSKRMTKEETESFDFYMKCRKDYADTEFSVKGDLENFSNEDLAEWFGFNYVCNEDTGEELYTYGGEFQFPFIVFVLFECDRDRMGHVTSFIIDFIEKKEFESDYKLFTLKQDDSENA
jgi:hypothetical protein